MKGTLVLVSLCSACMAFAEGAPLSPADAVKPVTRAQLRRMSTAERIRYNGGLLFSAPTGKVIRVVNAQKLVPASTLDPMIDGFKVAMGLTLFPMEVEEKGLFPVVKRGFADLDANVSLVVSPEPFTKMMDNAEALGIRRVRHTTYRKACYEGWAPPPTNAYQKAIWDMVHALPTEPMKIKPETKKVSD